MPLNLGAWWDEPAYKTCNTFHLRGGFIFDKLKHHDAVRFAELLSDLYRIDQPDPQDIGKFEWQTILAYMGANDGKSTIIESPTVKAARLFYKGRLEPASLAVAFRTTLEANGWRHLSSTTAAGKGTTQVYEKAGSSLQVLIYEGWYYTWAELAATRIIGREPAPAR